MRIEAYNQVQQLYQPRQVNKAQQAVSMSHTDQLQLSNKGRDLQNAKSAVANAPDVREELMASIKSRIQDGTYEVSTMAFADKLAQKYNEMR